MKTKIFVIAFFIVSLFYIGGCSKPVATVNDKKIDRKTFDMHLKEKIQEHKQRNVKPNIERLKEAVIQELIAEQLILEAAETEGIKVSEEELNQQIEAMRNNRGEDAFNKALKDKGITLNTFKERTREKMIMSRFINRLVGEDDITEEEITEYYKNSPRPFIKSGRVLMKLIEITTEDAAQAVVKEMKKDKIDFDDMAKKLADENRAIVSGYGWVNPDFFSPSIADAVKNLKIGTYGGPYKGQKSYFLIRIKEREKESIAKFDEVKENIKNILLGQKRQAALAHLVARKKRLAKIEINIK